MGNHKGSETGRVPALFVPHGGGPMPLLGDKDHAPLVNWLTGEARSYFQNPRPKAILLVTAHWETDKPTLSSGAKHELMYDYGGFPPEAYRITYDAPGEPSVAKRAYELLNSAGLDAKLDPKREWDHGVYVPLKLLNPEADAIPVVQMSTLRSQDATQHLRIGRALEPLRDEGVAIVGSGMSYHNLRAWFGMNPGERIAFNEPFDSPLTAACEAPTRQEREEKLANWEKMPMARQCHPPQAAEHLMPLMVAAGAGGEGPGKRVFNWTAWSASIGGFLW